MTITKDQIEAARKTFTLALEPGHDSYIAQAVTGGNFIRVVSSLLSGDLSALKAVCPEGYAVVPELTDIHMLNAGVDVLRENESIDLKDGKLVDADLVVAIFDAMIAAAQSEGGE